VWLLATQRLLPMRALAFFAVYCAAIALLLRILRRWHKALTAVMPLPFSATSHALSMPIFCQQETKKIQEEEIF